MTEKISTNTLMKRLMKANDLDAFLEENEAHMNPTSFCDMLREICRDRGLVPERVIRQSQIDRTYGHQLFNGTRRPSRDKVLQLCFGLQLNVEEAQRLLRAAQRSDLYPRLKRDAVILYCLRNGHTVPETQEVLAGQGLTVLGGVPRDGE